MSPSEARMKLLIVGYGKMGRMVEELAAADGFEIVGRVDQGRDEWVAKARRTENEEGSRFGTFVETAEHDFLHAGGFLVIGAAQTARFDSQEAVVVADLVKPKVTRDQGAR